jgi:hypothetical protein
MLVIEGGYLFEVVELKKLVNRNEGRGIDHCSLDTWVTALG